MYYERPRVLDFGLPLECLQTIEDMPLERHIPHRLLTALSSFLRALELTAAIFVADKRQQKTEIRVECWEETD
jgi:hypothetical protein